VDNAWRTSDNPNISESPQLHAIRNAKDSLFWRKLADLVSVQARPGDSGVSSVDECQRGISPGVLHENVLSARMIPQELRAIVHVIANHQPAIVGRVMTRDLVQSDRPRTFARFLLARLQPAPSFLHGVALLQHVATLQLDQVVLRRFHIPQLEGAEAQVQKIHDAATLRSALSATEYCLRLEPHCGLMPINIALARYIRCMRLYPNVPYYRLCNQLSYHYIILLIIKMLCFDKLEIVGS